MHNDVRTYLDKLVEDGLEKCTDPQVHMFRRMYKHDDLDAPIKAVVTGIPDEKLENAWDQVKRTIIKNDKCADGLEADA